MGLFSFWAEAAKNYRSYRKYRKAGMEFIHSIMESALDEDAILGSAKILGMLSEDGTILFDSEAETNVLMDFALHEYRIDGRNAIETYRAKIGGKNDEQKELLAGWIASATSLFQVESTSPGKGSLTLCDVLNRKEGIQLMDINCSRTVSPGMLLFFRLVPMPGFFMTSGVSFFFPAKEEKKVLGKFRKLMTKLPHTDSMNRFLSFFQLYRKHGMPVRYE